jgi:hypothetical protein
MSFAEFRAEGQAPIGEAIGLLLPADHPVGVILEN